MVSYLGGGGDLIKIRTMLCCFVKGCSAAPLVQQCSLGHSLSTSDLCTLTSSNLCTQLHPPLHIITPHHQMEVVSDATSCDHTHQALRDGATTLHHFSPPGSPKRRSMMCSTPVPVWDQDSTITRPTSPELQGAEENEVPMQTSPPSPTGTGTLHYQVSYTCTILLVHCPCWPPAICAHAKSPSHRGRATNSTKQVE